MGCTGHLLTQAYLMTSWQALRALVSAIPFDDPFKTRAHTANAWTHLVCLIVESHKIAKKNFQTFRHQSAMFLFLWHNFMSYLMSLAIVDMQYFFVFAS